MAIRDVAGIGLAVFVAISKVLAGIWNVVVIAIIENLALFRYSVLVTVRLTSIRNTIQIAVGIALVRNAIFLKSQLNRW